MRFVLINSLTNTHSHAKMSKYSFILTLLLLSLAAVTIKPTNGVGYEGTKIYEVQPKTRQQCDFLFELSKNEESYDFLLLSKLPQDIARVIVKPSEEQNFINLLNANDFSYKLINNNFGATLESEFAENRLLRKLLPFTGKGRLSTKRYYTHKEINDYIVSLAALYPTRVTVQNVGKSTEQLDLKTITITNGDGVANKAVIWVDGGFHAREWISPAAVLYVIDQLVENFAANKDLLETYDWVILPVVNPDGYEYTQTSPSARMWRKTRKVYGACLGADPNRNFAFHWGEGGSSGQPCSDTYRGPQPFSEPETAIVRDLLLKLTGRGKFYLTIHSYGNYLLYPWGWTSTLPDTWRDLDDVAQAGGQAINQATGTKYTIGSSTNVLYVAAGGSDDYAFSIGFPISITMELTGGGSTGFDPPPSQIDGFVKETWIGIRAMAKRVMYKYN